MSSSDSAIKGRRALVLGGGIAGLAAAGVLARHFEQVTLLERDRYPGDTTVRPHTAHGAHAHLLLAGGLVTLAKLVPELPGWLDEAGLPAGDLTHHTRIAYAGKWLQKTESGIPIRTCTRADIELLLRRDVARRGNVEVIDDCKVEGLLGADRVTGARFNRGGTMAEMNADLVVDAMGRGSPATAWLEAFGARVEEEVVDPGILYSTAWFEPPPDIDDDWTVLATMPSFPDDGRMGIAIRFGKDRMICSSIDYGKPPPARSPAELVERFGTLSVPQLHRIARASKPISEVMVYGNTQNRRRRYGQLKSFPDGLVVIGDAVCALNPRYGHGMTVAAICADRLDEEIASHAAKHGSLDGFSHRFQKALDKELALPWDVSLMDDEQWVSHLAGKAPGLSQKVGLWGSRRLLETAFSDVDVYIRFMRVAQMLDAPGKMFRPGVIASFLRGGRAGQEGEAPGVGPH